jgi:hypothetical protein
MSNPLSDEDLKENTVYEDTRVLHISPIKIMMHLNTPTKDNIEFTRDIIQYTDTDENTKPPSQKTSSDSNKYPFFTNSVKYPKSLIMNRGYLFALDFFFNKELFESTLRENYTDYANQDDVVEDPLIEQASDTIDIGNVGHSIEDIKITLMDNTEYNVMTMLRCLMPISNEFGKVTSSTYRQYILGEFNMNIFAFNFLNPFKDDYLENLSLNVVGKPHLVTDVVWLNDTINHPIYREFVKTYNVKMRERLGFEKAVNVLINDKARDFTLKIAGFYTTRNPTGAPPGAPPDDIYNKLLNDLGKNRVSGAPTTLDKRQNAKNDTITTMESYLKNQSFIDNVNEIVKYVNVANKKPTIRKFTDMGLYDVFIQKVDEIANVITSVYNAMYMYNASKEFMITLSSDVTRQLGFLYMSAISVKTAKLVKLFIVGSVPQFDLNEKNRDGSDKSKEELDIIRELRDNHAQYVSLSKEINEALLNIYPPVRESSNFELQQLLKNMKEQQANPPSASTTDRSYSMKAEPDFFKDIYAKYITRTKRYSFPLRYTYTGVNTIATTESKESTAKVVYKEIHLLVDVVDKEKYMASKGSCEIKDDILTNEFLYLLNFDNLYQVNPYRLYESFDHMILNEKPDARIDAPSNPPSTPATNAESSKEPSSNNKTISQKGGRGGKKVTKRKR